MFEVMTLNADLPTAHKVSIGELSYSRSLFSLYFSVPSMVTDSVNISRALDS